MGGTRITTGSRVVPFRKRVLAFPPRTKVNRGKPVLRGGEIELLERLGERKRRRDTSVVELRQRPQQPRLF
jgi:hypothetical protein